MDQMWPIITNKKALAVNQQWAGHPGQRLFESATAQIWAKPLGDGGQHGVFFLSTADHTQPKMAIPLSNISAALASAPDVCLRLIH